MNVESQWDGMVGGKPLFPGTGHGDELEYVFGLTKDWRYPYYNNYLNPLDWEHDVTLFCERPGIQIDVFLDISSRDSRLDYEPSYGPITWISISRHFESHYSQWTRFNHRGEPWIDWTLMGNELNLMEINNNNPSIFSMAKPDTALNFWLNQWTPELFIVTVAKCVLLMTKYDRFRP